MFSILLPIYNGIEFIEESVNSVLNQTYDNWELLILINGHPKDSEIYKKACSFLDKRINVYDFYDLKGKSITLNKGLIYCNYNNICILDVDDYWYETKLEEQLKYIDKYDIVGTMCQYFGDSDVIPYIPTGEIKSEFFKIENPIINSSSCFKKNDAQWKSEYDSVEDYEMWLRLNKIGNTFYNIPQILVKHRIHSNSSFNSTNKQKELREILIKKYSK
jgi:glycosyltransferase involved in cell wall biosynthesis